MKSPIIHLMSWLCAALTLPLSAQVRESWIARHTISATGTNQAVAMTLDKNGNLIVAGHGTSTNGDFDYVVLKYAPDGNKLRSSRYNSAIDANDQVRAAAMDADGNMYVTGTTKTLKYSSNGSLQWVVPYGARGLALDPHGDVCITGFSEDTGLAPVWWTGGG